MLVFEKCVVLVEVDVLVPVKFVKKLVVVDVVGVHSSSHAHCASAGGTNDTSSHVLSGSPRCHTCASDCAPPLGLRLCSSAVLHTNVSLSSGWFAYFQTRDATGRSPRCYQARTTQPHASSEPAAEPSP